MPRLKNAAGTVIEVDDGLAERMKGHGWSPAGSGRSSGSGASANAAGEQHETREKSSREEKGGGGERASGDGDSSGGRRKPSRKTSG